MIKTLLILFASCVVAENQLPSWEWSPDNMCNMNGDKYRVNEVQETLNTFTECFYGLFEPNTTETSWDKDSYKFHVDAHCKKACQLKKCLESFTDGMEPCLVPTLSNEYTVSKGGVELVLNYICYENENQFGLFFNSKDHHRDCFQLKTLECINNQTSTAPITEASMFLAVNRPCDSCIQLATCVVTALETCSDQKRPVSSWPSNCCNIYNKRL